MITMEMDRLGHISVAHDVAAIKECHHRRNPLDLTPCAYPKTLNASTRCRGHRIGTIQSLRESGSNRRCPFPRRERGDSTGRELRKGRDRPCQPHPQRESITYWCRE